MTIEEEIQAEKEESMKELLFLIEYEGAAHWLAGWIWFDWGQELMAEYLVWKARRKWKKYKLYKLLKDVDKIKA